MSPLKDIFTVDEVIPQTARSWLQCLLTVLGTLFVICLATPFFAVIIIPLAIVYYFVQVSCKLPRRKIFKYLYKSLVCVLK